MKTDALYLNLFETTPSLGLHLAGYDIERGSEYTCRSHEFKRSFRVDAVFTPPTKDLPFILAEVQFQPDKDIYDRLVASYAIARMKKGKGHKGKAYSDVRMVLFFKNRGVDTGAGVWQPMVESGALQVVYLDEATERVSGEFGTRAYGNGTDGVSIAEVEVLASLTLARLTVTPKNREADTVLVEEFRSIVSLIAAEERRKFFAELFVNLFVSKYNTLTIEEIRAMIDTRDIFDDIGESRAVLEYAEIQVQKATEEATIKNALAFIEAGIPIEQVANILHIPVSDIEAARQAM